MRERVREGVNVRDGESAGEGEMLFFILMIVGPTKLYRFNRSDQLLIPVGPVRPELIENFYLVVYRVSLKLIAVIKFNYR